MYESSEAPGSRPDLSVPTVIVNGVTVTDNAKEQRAQSLLAFGAECES